MYMSWALCLFVSCCDEPVGAIPSSKNAIAIGRYLLGTISQAAGVEAWTKPPAKPTTIIPPIRTYSHLS